MVLLQYAEDDGPIYLHEVWNSPILKTLELIEWLCEDTVCAFNLVYDWFHLNKIYNILRVFYDNGYSGIPTINEVAEIEQYNPSQYCLKPAAALDIMLVGRRTKYQYVMKRKPITIRKVPQVAADKVAQLLQDYIDLPEICFTKDPEGYKWRVKPHEDPETGEEVPDFRDVQLQFRGSTSLMAMAGDILGEDKADWPIPRDMNPTEKSWHPYGQHGERPWKYMIGRHIAMWQSNQNARYYAWKDVDILRKLHRTAFNEFQGGDTDSELAAALGATRWRGFALDHDKIERLIEKYNSECQIAPRAAHAVQNWIWSDLSEAEQTMVKSTRAEVLETLRDYGSTDEVKRKSSLVLRARQAWYRRTLLTRLWELPRFHPEFKVIGTKSNRQSGGGEEKTKGSINPQGIPREYEIRECFKFADEDEELWGGDADSYEVSIMAAVFNDPVLNDELQSGLKFHALMGEIWYGLSYEDMMYEKERKDTSETLYDKTKEGDFAMFYGAEDQKLEEVLGIENVSSSMERFQEKYRALYEGRRELAMKFCSMRQPGGPGTEVIWHEPAEYVESLFGFRRYFTLENEICRALFQLANDPPKSLRKDKSLTETKCVRRSYRGSQSALGALQSALYATAFNLQAANMRAACNHVIQSPGGEITKEFQVECWKDQPIGIHEWKVRTFNMHDELMGVTDGTVDMVSKRDTIIERHRKYIPLLAWDMKKMSHWGDK